MVDGGWVGRMDRVLWDICGDVNNDKTGCEVAMVDGRLMGSGGQGFVEHLWRCKQ